MTLVQLIYLVCQLSTLHFLGNLETCWFVHNNQFFASEVMGRHTQLHHYHLVINAVLGKIKHPRKSASNFCRTFRVPLGIRNQKNAVPPAWHKRESERSRRASKSELTFGLLATLRAGGQKWSTTLSQERVVLPPSSPAIVDILHNPVRIHILIRFVRWN